MSTRAEISERKEAIKAFIINNPSTWFTVNKLKEELPDKYSDISWSTIRNDIHDVCESLGGTLLKSCSKYGGFKFVPTDVVVKHEELLSTLYDPEEQKKLEWALGAINCEDPEDKFKSPWVNHEGYSDPTAKKALENIPKEATNRRDIAKWDVGSVWDTTASAKAHELILVVRADTLKSIVLPLFEKDAYKIDGNEEYTRIIKYKSYTYYTDIRCLRTKPNKYFLEEQFVIDKGELEGLLLDISRLFTEGNPLLQRRVDVLETQADKYRIMINDLRAEVEKLTGENKKLTSIISDLEERDQNHCDEMSVVLSEQSNTYFNEMIKLRNSNEALESHIRELWEKNAELVNTIAEQENEIKSLREKEPVEVTNIERALLNQRLQIYEAFLKSFGVTF